MSNIILLSDVYEMRRRKEEELAFYHRELEKLKLKMSFVQSEIHITNICIDMIERDQVIELNKLKDRA